MSAESSLSRCEWKECRLGEVINLIGGGTPKTSIAEYWDGNIPWLSVVDFNTGRKFVETTEKSITQKGLEKSSTKILNVNDIIISARGTVGAMAVLKKPMAFNQSCYGIRNVPSSTDQGFLYYLIKDSVSGFQQIAHGGVFDTITRETFDAMTVSLPSLPEQRTIATVLSSLDDKIDLLYRQNKTLEVMAETLFRQWFVEEAEDSWPTVKLGDFVRTNTTSLSVKYPYSVIQYLDTSSLAEGRITSLQILDVKDAPSRAKRLVSHNDVLISTVRPDQKHYGIIKNPASNLVVSTGFCVISCDKLDPHFVYTYLTSYDMTEYLHSIAEGSTSTYPSLKPSDIEKLDFQLPPDSKLKAFANYASNAWTKLDRNHEQIKRLEKIRDNLLPKLMSGEVGVKI